MIAGVEISVMFQRKGIAARLVENAQARRVSHPRLQRDIENLHEDFADVVHHPLIENLAEEFAVLPCGDGARRHVWVFWLAAEMFHCGDELHKRHTKFLEIGVDLLRILGVVAVDNAEHVIVNLVLLQNA